MGIGIIVVADREAFRAILRDLPWISGNQLIVVLRDSERAGVDWLESDVERRVDVGVFASRRSAQVAGAFCLAYDLGNRGSLARLERLRVYANDRT